MTTPSTDPVPVVPAPIPVPSPVTPSANLTSATWWQWALTTVVSLGVGISVLFNHPFSSTLIDAIVPSAALLAASIATALQVHGSHAVKIAQLNYEREIRIVQMQLTADRNNQSSGQTFRSFVSPS